jgi:hypothetical protein
MRATRDQIEEGWLSLVREGESASDIGMRCRSSVRFDTISGHLRSLYQQGLLGRRWRGSLRYGCWEYTPHRESSGYFWESNH